MKMIKFPLLLLLSIFLLTDCKKESKTDNPDATADEITDWLKIDGAVKKSGNPPSPTVGAPILTNLSPTTGGVTDGTFAFKFKASDDFEGIYLKVKGASSYLDIPFSTTGEKLAAGKSGIMGGARKDGIAYRDTTGEIIIIIDLDDASNPEEFCYEYCLYDATSGVSNIVEVCVTIADWGGLDQLVGKWKWDGGFKRFNGIKEYYYYPWGYLDSTACSVNSPLFITKNYNFIEFFKSGDFNNYTKEVLYSGSPCNNVITFYNNERNIRQYGKWSYDVQTNKLIMIEIRKIYDEGTPIEHVSEYHRGVGEVFWIKTINSNELIIANIDNIFEDFLKRY